MRAFLREYAGPVIVIAAGTALMVVFLICGLRYGVIRP